MAGTVEDDFYCGEPWNSLDRWIDARGYRDWWEEGDMQDVHTILDLWNAESEIGSLFAEVPA